MKTLSPDEIQCLLGVRPSKAHPLDILGYSYGSEGARLFRAERPNFLPQVVGYIRSVLAGSDVFPQGINGQEPRVQSFPLSAGARILAKPQAGSGAR